MKQIILIGFAFLLFGCSSPTTAQDDLMAAIQEREDAWSAAFNAGDADTLGAIYTADSVLIPPESDPVWGREGAVATLSGLFGVLLDLQLTADDVRAMGDDHAVEIGHGTFETMGEDGVRVAGRVDYVVVWEKGDDGVWYYSIDIFNAAGAGE